MFTFSYIPSIINLSPNNVLENATHNTNSYTIFISVMLARDRSYVPNHSTVLTLVNL